MRTTNLRRHVRMNSNYRKVLSTSKNMQIVIMSLKPGESIPLEVHNDTDQLFYVISGKMGVITGRSKKSKHLLAAGCAYIVNMRTYHTVRNVGKVPLKFYTVYSPPHHRRGLIQKSAR